MAGENDFQAAKYSGALKGIAMLAEIGMTLSSRDIALLREISEWVFEQGEYRG